MLECEQAIFSPNREPVHKLWNVPLRSFNLDSILCLLRQNSFNTIDTVSDRFFFFQGSTETLFTWNDMNEVSHLCKFSGSFCEYRSTDYVIQ